MTLFTVMGESFGIFWVLTASQDFVITVCDGYYSKYHLLVNLFSFVK